MSKIVIGVDPDSKAHGVAVYIDGRLSRLECLTLYWLVDALEFYSHSENEIEVHIEDVCAMNAVFRQRQGSNQSINMKMSNSVGKCQQSQIELERFIHHKGIKVTKHKISKMWKKDKKQFEKVTGWTCGSNEDTRSAAYFGFLGLS
jgi:hypothetical protein